jgi:hypothetical protein
METVEGEDVWYSMEFALTEGTVSREYIKEFIESFAAISIKISEAPFEAIGSPATNHKGEIVIGNLVSKGYPQFIEGPYYAGPFTNQRDRWTARSMLLLYKSRMAGQESTDLLSAILP